MSYLNLIIEPDVLDQHLDDPDIVIIDLCKEKQYQQAHIPEAQYIAYQNIVHIEKPVMGLLPDADQFSRVISNAGITENTHVVAYDDEGGGCAARLIWTLHVYGHEKTSLLNGGLHSWSNEGRQLNNKTTTANASSYTLTNTGRHTTDRAYIIDHLEDTSTALLDARSAPEYKGEKKFAEKAGHIPGAVHFEWTNAMDLNNNLRLLPKDIIQQRLDQLGLTSNKEIITYCQSHHRSAFSWLMLKYLGYENVKGYPGSWSDWGNHPDTPVE